MIKLVYTILLFLLHLYTANSQEKQITQYKIKEDLDKTISDVTQNYVYLQEKNVDLDCIRTYDANEIENVENQEQAVLFFGYLLHEFYDNHRTLGTNTNSPCGLFAPIYEKVINGKPIISNVRQTQTKELNQDVIGTEMLAFDHVYFKKVI